MQWNSQAINYNASYDNMKVDYKVSENGLYDIE